MAGFRTAEHAKQFAVGRLSLYREAGVSLTMNCKSFNLRTETDGGFRTTTKLSSERRDVSLHDFLTHHLGNVYKMI
ncbi:hypothetical protein QQF64_004859 [Cirrhinus molitorella]|uniref:Uncharacterized protein n=1 Tax=Cirrhinus molitorella TaxID=172907 RepID=A0ABR3MK51_9TELE